MERKYSKIEDVHEIIDKIFDRYFEKKYKEKILMKSSLIDFVWYYNWKDIDTIFYDSNLYIHDLLFKIVSTESNNNVKYYVRIINIKTNQPQFKEILEFTNENLILCRNKIDEYLLGYGIDMVLNNLIDKIETEESVDLSNIL